MTNNKNKQRVEKLFVGMEPLVASKPPNITPALEDSESAQTAQSMPIPDEMEALRLRVRELEAQLAEKESKPYATPLLYEKEEVGFAYSGNEIKPVRGDQFEAQNEADIVKTPLTSSGQIIGEVQVAQSPEHPITSDDIQLANAVAQQVSLQIENLRLLAAAERARAEAEDATRRLTRQNWENYAQQEDAATGFVYDSLKVSPLATETITSVIDLEQPLIVRGEPIGRLSISGLPNVSDEAKEIAAAIARQTSIHLETLRLTEELQRRAQELKELDRLKSAFLANMSHELRTPLNSILGFSDVILEGLDGPLTPNMSNDLRLIQKNGQHLLHLINDVLDMAKIESGRMNLHPERFKVHELLDEVTSITSTLASEKNTALFIAEDSDREVEIYADSTRIRQVMLNLANNAIKFTANGKISLRASKISGGRVLISVKDTGVGIPQDHLEAIFLEFTQVDTSTTRKAGGTGLGLPISRRLIEMHGGRLWAESAGVEGEGSTFYMELPIEARITDVIERQEK